ncbi:MAG TPA: prenyltransferase/squalene oxidase repeat-containing protein [Solirubrobacterales bacterium]
MSWEAISFLIVLAVVLGGFAWYERSRPPSQVVALVAALAALAIAGRIAFAAFPNVKPTTDIVIFAGYALGAAPGFAVGALAALVSNFWFGQGPWTPWQMAGWGMCGVFGAALALGGRNAGRLTLAAACGLAGIAYGALLNFSLMATYGGDLSLERFLTLEARAIPFDVAHAAGNVALALVAGPAMVRMLTRFRTRFEWRIPAPAVAALLVALLLPALFPASSHAAAGGASAWLVSAQNGDGGWGSSPDDESSAAMTSWAMLGLEAAGRNPFDVQRSGRSPVDFLRRHAEEVSSTGDIARTILALQGAGADPRSFAGRNLVAELLKRRRANGSFEGWPGTTAFSVIALREAGATGGLGETTSWLGRVQNNDGGWGDVPGSPSTADGTGAVMQAMPGTKAAQRGLSYLRKAQRPSGGYVTGSNGPANSQSTGWAIQGMIAVGADPSSIEEGGHSAYDYLAARQAGDGHYRYSSSSDQTPVWVTGQVLVAVSGTAFPLTPSPRTPAPKPPANNNSSTGTTAKAPSTGSSATPGSPAASGSSPASGSSAVSPTTGSGGGGGAPPERFATPRSPTPGGIATPPPAGSREREGPSAAPPEPVVLQQTADIPDANGSSSGQAAAATAFGLAAGTLAFGAFWWLRKRYGW